MNDSLPGEARFRFRVLTIPPARSQLTACAARLAIQQNSGCSNLQRESAPPKSVENAPGGNPREIELPLRTRRRTAPRLRLGLRHALCEIPPHRPRPACGMPQQITLLITNIAAPPRHHAPLGKTERNPAAPALGRGIQFVAHVLEHRMPATPHPYFNQPRQWKSELRHAVELKCWCRPNISHPPLCEASVSLIVPRSSMMTPKRRPGLEISSGRARSSARTVSIETNSDGPFPPIPAIPSSPIAHRGSARGPCRGGDHDGDERGAEHALLPLSLQRGEVITVNQSGEL